MKTIKRSLFIMAAAVIPLFLSACFQSETTIHLNKDGSGTLIEETRLGAQMLAMMDQMSAGFGGGGAEKPKEDPMKQMFSEEKARTRAAELGEGVAFEKSEPVNLNGSKGARVTYRFNDINKLRISAGDGMKNMSPMGEAPAAAVKKKVEPITFSYASGKLTIRMPEPKKPDAAGKPDVEGTGKPDMDNPQAQAMMKQMMGDMKLSLKLIADSGISSSDATYTDGNTVTLMEMNMGKLVENADNLKKLGKANQDDPIAVAEMLKGIDGIKVETKREVTVELQ